MCRRFGGSISSGPGATRPENDQGRAESVKRATATTEGNVADGTGAGRPGPPTGSARALPARVQRPSSPSDGWSSGRRPSGQRNSRWSSRIGRSLMLA
ncbi:hypothetical protein DYY90_11310 [Pseudomonas aeruginosa]|nr:hypothetical protein [Pseudomonas aeruginosa]RNL92897.1 hypothetical protein EB236_17725 [Pseudomonas aeruginosa]HBP5528109.1 hypothetical protein [Pseudomonas aeruginosa]HBP5921019.1 hypothetical protein [Pseudomonas aeruginosa]HBP5952277.1 hypothetical protein [Pseudomonas aeruginosa]